MFSMKISFSFAEVDLAQAFSDEIRVEMATVDRGDLHDRHILFCNRVGVVARRRIAVENRYADFDLLAFRPAL